MDNTEEGNKNKTEELEDQGFWYTQHEVILKNWAEEAYSFQYIHDKEYKSYQRLNIWFSLPVIILSTIAGTANFSQGSVPKEYVLYVALFTGFLNLACGLITTISQFLKIGELLESHRVNSIDFGKLARNISTELSLPVSQRRLSGQLYVQECRAEICRLIENSPDIGEVILKKFLKKFSNSDFNKPNILDIKEVKVYTDDQKIIIEKDKEFIEKTIEDKIKEKIIKNTNLENLHDEALENQLRNTILSIDKLK